MERGHHVDECVAAFPSVTPVCSASIATGAGPDRHLIPSMNWYHREEERYVEYGTSFRASQAFGFKRSLTDTIYNMNAEHLSRETPTVFESLDDAGVRTAGTTYLMYRGRHRHEVDERDGADADRLDGVQAARLRPARVLLRRPVRVAPDRLPLAARPAGRPRPARGLRRRVPGRARPVRLPAALAARQRHALAQARPGRPGHLARGRRPADRAADARRGRPGRLPRGPRRDRLLATTRSPQVEDEIDLFRALRRLRRAPAERRAGAKPAGRRRSRCARARAPRRSTCSTATRAPALVPRVDADAARARGRRPRDAHDRPPRRRGGGPLAPRRAALRAARRPHRPARASAGAWRATSTCSRSRRSDGRVRSARYPDALGRVWSALRCRTAGEVLASAGPAGSSSTGGARTTSAAARTARCTRTTRSARCCGAGPGRIGRRARAVDPARHRADGARPLRRGVTRDGRGARERRGRLAARSREPVRLRRRAQPRLGVARAVRRLPAAVRAAPRADHPARPRGARARPVGRRTRRGRAGTSACRSRSSTRCSPTCWRGCCGSGSAPGAAAAVGPLRLSAARCSSGCCFLLAFRVTLNVVDGNVIDVGQASVIGGEPPARRRIRSTAGRSRA